MAEECLKWARETHDRDVRASLSQLAEIWLDAAFKLDWLVCQCRISINRPRERLSARRIQRLSCPPATSRRRGLPK